MVWSRLILLFIFGLSLAACSSEDEENDELDRLNLKELYTQGQDDLNNENYEQAAKKFEKIETRFPFGSYAESAELNLMYAYFKDDKPEETIAIADRFIRLHPDHAHADYAYYIRGLANYYSGYELSTRFLPGDYSKRDITTSRASFDDFSTLINSYPNSQYVTDAHARMVHLRNVLAQHEVNIGQYYLRRHAFVAAANRGRYVVEHYQEAPAMPEALTLMVDAYYNLGMPDLADDTKKILVANYPNYKSIASNGNFIPMEDTGPQEKTWLNMLTFGLID